MKDEALVCYVVYRYPVDYPDQYVIRCHRLHGAHVDVDLDAHAIGSTLDDVRRTLPRGLVNVGRHPADEPQILEVWL